MDRDILKVVDELFRRRLQVPELELDAPLPDYGLDSVRSIDLIVELEELYDVRVSDGRAATMRTPRDVATRLAAPRTVPVGQGNGAR